MVSDSPEPSSPINFEYYSYKLEYIDWDAVLQLAVPPKVAKTNVGSDRAVASYKHYSTSGSSDCSSFHTRIPSAKIININALTYLS